jgi:hypothetical protein
MMSEADCGSLTENVKPNSVVRLPGGQLAQVVAQRKPEWRAYM